MKCISNGGACACLMLLPASGVDLPTISCTDLRSMSLEKVVMIPCVTIHLLDAERLVKKQQF